MSDTYLDLYREIKGDIQELPEPIAKKIVTRVYRRLLNMRHWAHLVDEGVYFAPDQITTGSMSITQHSVSVTPNASALTALTGLTNPLITKRQIRFDGGPVYDIQTFDGATLTLKKPVREATSSSAGYSVFRGFFNGPLTTTFDVDNNAITSETTDFAEMMCVWDHVNGFVLKPHFMGSQLARTDPLRSASGEPLRIYAYRSQTSSGEIDYEFWPHPLSEQSWRCLFRRKGSDLLLDEDELMEPISAELVKQAAMIEACKWGLKNLRRVPISAWQLSLQQHRVDYLAELNECKKRDRSLSRAHEFVNDWSTYGFGIDDSNFWQSHAPDVFGMLE